MNSPVIERIESLCIDKKSNELIYLQIVDAIIMSIQKGELKHHQKLPGTRKFAELLNVNRNTVVRSLDELQALGFVKIIPNQGTYIVAPHQEKVTAFATTNFQEKATFNFNQSILLDVPTNDKNYAIEINDGKYDARDIEFKIPAKRYGTLLKTNFNPDNFHSKESSFFLNQLANYINATRNLNIQPANLLITRTPEMALQIISKVLISDNSLIAVDQLSDYKANMILQHNQGKLITIESDQYGICTEDLRRICQSKMIQAIYLNANSSYPTSVTLSNQRKIELIELSNQFGFVIIENDADFDFYYTHHPNYPLATNNSLNNIIYISQFGNELSPGFRLSYIIAPEDYIREAKKHLAIYESPIDPLVLRTIAEMIYEGDIGRILKKQRKFLKEKRDLCYQLLIENLGSKISVEVPKNGFAFWITFNQKINLLQLKNHLENDGIYLPQQNLYQTEKVCGIRLGFTNLNENEMIKVINSIKNNIN